MKATLIYAGLVTALAWASMASGQTYVTPSSEAATVAASGYYPDGGYYYGGGYHSSTAEEGYLAGLGHLRRSTGEMNYFNSLASIGRGMGLSRERVRQLEHQAQGRVREALRASA